MQAPFYVLWLKMRDGICLYGSEDVALNCKLRLDFVVLGARCASPAGIFISVCAPQNRNRGLVGPR
ncbi:MAG TPA: hypothetical protein DCQ10_07485 [Rhodobacteraceae bacterium]|nr:hypothetical protein [Marinovum sp.]HAM90487.1 hypothetical protein [Paracoccaceae bacterium]